MEDEHSLNGLTEEQAEELRKSGMCNSKPKKTTKSYRHILFENIFSIFNLINVFIAASLLYVGSYKNCLFMLAVISNTLIGIVQEVRSKRVTDRLSIINISEFTVIREGKRRSVKREELVKGDLIELDSGSQIPNDCEVCEGQCEVNESLLTGESDPIVKLKGDKLLSGSFISSGHCICRITAVGNESFAQSLLSEIKYVKRCSSVIVQVLKRMIAVITVCIVPIGAMLFYNQYGQDTASLREAVESSAAALIGMIPEGLVLLTSTVFALGVVRLSKRSVLSQDLYSLEALARTDVLCLDKTGTLTTGEMSVSKMISAQGVDESVAELAVRIFASLSHDTNATMRAIRLKFTPEDSFKLTSSCPFSSERKWSSVTAEGFGTIIVGAADRLFDNESIPEEAQNYRVLAVALSESEIQNYELPTAMRPLCFLLLSEELREGVSDTLSYFKSQGVCVKIISGDNPSSVQRLCAGVLGENAGCVDLSGVSDDEISAAAENNTVFGRATPTQKKLLVKTLRENGHTVGMVGDGVNDVLALKESDCSIAPANGSDAARNVSQLILLNSDFSGLPAVVSEGRRSINNLQSSAAIFLAKTIFSAVMALVFMFIDKGYPLAPIQMTLVSTLTIGFPSFILSFIKNDAPISGSFLRNVIDHSVPAAMTNILSVMTAVVLSSRFGFTDEETATLCVMSLAVTGLSLIYAIYRPLSPIKAAVLIASVMCFAAAFLLFGEFFGFCPIFGRISWYMVMFAIFDIAILSVLLIYFSKRSQHARKTMC